MEIPFLINYAQYMRNTRRTRISNEFIIVSVVFKKLSLRNSVYFANFQNGKFSKTKFYIETEYVCEQ